MQNPRFKVGDTVRVEQRVNPHIPSGNYKVVRLLPTVEGDHQYRLRSSLDGQERVVRESELG